MELKQDEVLKQEEVKPPRVAKHRLTVVETVYHNRAQRNPIGFDTRFSRELNSDEQPYSREITVTEEWQALDCGWITDCSMLVIKNLAGQFLSRNPTPEAKAEIAAQIVEVGLEPTWLVHPGESMRACPASTQDIVIRCRKGSCKVSIWLVPS